MVTHSGMPWRLRDYGLNAGFIVLRKDVGLYDGVGDGDGGGNGSIDGDTAGDVCWR